MKSMLRERNVDHCNVGVRLFLQVFDKNGLLKVSFECGHFLIPSSLFRLQQTVVVENNST